MKELLDKLKKANKLFAENNIEAELTIVGGSALILKGIINRATFDIDYINRIDNTARELLRGLEINDNLVGPFQDQYGLWENDRELIKAMSNIVIYTLSNERLVASRVFSNKRFEDLEKALKNKKINIKRFETVVREIFENTADPIYIKEFQDNQNHIKKVYEEIGENYENSVFSKLCKK